MPHSCAVEYPQSLALQGFLRLFILVLNHQIENNSVIGSLWRGSCQRSWLKGETLAFDSIYISIIIIHVSPFCLFALRQKSTVSASASVGASALQRCPPDARTLIRWRQTAEYSAVVHICNCYYMQWTFSSAGNSGLQPQIITTGFAGKFWL